MLQRTVFAAVFIFACSPGPAPVSRSSTDPVSPSAPEGMNPMLAVAAPSPSHGQSADPHQHQHQHQQGTTTYVCPMHPEVTSDKPDQVCPKCNMKLVPKQ